MKDSNNISRCFTEDNGDFWNEHGGVYVNLWRFHRGRVEERWGRNSFTSSIPEMSLAQNEVQWPLDQSKEHD